MYKVVVLDNYFDFEFALNSTNLGGSMFGWMIDKYEISTGATWDRWSGQTTQIYTIVFRR